MLCLWVRISVCVFLIVLTSSLENPKNISFQNVDVTMRWSLGRNMKTRIKSATHLNENLPSNVLDTEIGITITGSVPILYANSVRDLEKTTSLTLSSIGLREIKAKAFRNLNLDDLSLRKNQLREIVAAFDGVCVKTLDLSDNLLERIQPGVLKDIPCLSTLLLSNNKLKLIDSNVFNNPGIHFLDFRFNSVSALRSGDIKKLPRLETLSLTGNYLTEIPEGVFSNTNISYLRLSHNKIKRIAPNAFDNMTELIELLIDNNRLTQWDNNWLKETPRLSNLQAGYNHIEEILEKAFKNFPRIDNIGLAHNQIVLIEIDAFLTSESIGILDLSHNFIDSWDENLLSGLKQGTIYLFGNRIKCIDGDLKTVFKAVTVHFRGNPWDPNCPVKTDSYHPD